MQAALSVHISHNYLAEWLNLKLYLSAQQPDYVALCYLSEQA